MLCSEKCVICDLKTLLPKEYHSGSGPKWENSVVTYLKRAGLVKFKPFFDYNSKRAIQILNRVFI